MNKRKSTVKIKLVSLIVTIFVFIACSIYAVILFITPSIKIINDSTLNIKRALIMLPSNRLDFGSIKANQTNMLYYSIKQTEGDYHYHITFDNEKELNGHCGYVTANQIHKRVVITINTAHVVCESQ